MSVSGAPSTCDPPHPRWFWINVASLCLLAPWATYWFQQHLKLYFTGIVIIGGAFSLWVLLQAMWGFLQKAAKVDAWEHSRKLLAKPDVTVILAIAAAILLVLWYYTASLYITYEGAAKEGEYLVEIVREHDSSPMLAPVSLTAGTPVAGRPFLWQGAGSKLVCRILRPAKYEVLPCSLEPGHSTRILVPGSFKPREFHLLRIVPGGRLYAQLAFVEDAPESIKNLEIELRGQKEVLTDIRRQVIYTGAGEDEMPIVMALEQPGALAPHLRNRLLTKSDDVLSADRTTAILSLTTRAWPTFYVQKGDQLKLTARIFAKDGGRVLEEFSVDYTVTADKVQTIWLPE